MPAQLTTTCGTPKAFCAACASASTDRASPTSVASKRAAGAPAASQAAAAALPRVASRPATITRALSSAKRRAIARPMPEVPPMTTTVRGSDIAALFAVDIEELRHGLHLEIHHRASGLDAAADLPCRAQQRGLARLHDDVDDRH